MIDNALDIINNSNILDSAMIQDLTKIGEELSKTFRTVQRFRTKTEMQYSVLTDAKHPTPDSKYWQAIREQNAMFNELVILSYDYRKNIVEINKLKRDLSNIKDNLDKELQQIEIEKKQFILSNMQAIAAARIREILEWSSIKKELKSRLKYGDEDVNLHQLDAMKRRFAFEASLVNQNTAIADKINVIGKALAVEGK